MTLHGTGFTSSSVPAADVFGAADRLCASLGQSKSQLMGRIPHSELDGMHEPAESPGRLFCCASARSSPSDDVSRPFSFNLDGGDRLGKLCAPLVSSLRLL